MYKIHFIVYLQPASQFVESCVGTSINITCTVTAEYLLWKVNDMTRDFSMNGGNANKNIGDFYFELLSNNSQELVSMATLNNIHSNDNGTVLICESSIVPNPTSEQKANITIIVHSTGSLFIY